MGELAAARPKSVIGGICLGYEDDHPIAITKATGGGEIVVLFALQQLPGLVVFAGDVGIGHTGRRAVVRKAGWCDQSSQ